MLSIFLIMEEVLSAGEKKIPFRFEESPSPNDLLLCPCLRVDPDEAEAGFGAASHGLDETDTAFEGPVVQEIQERKKKALGKATRRHLSSPIFLAAGLLV